MKQKKSKPTKKPTKKATKAKTPEQKKEEAPASLNQSGPVVRVNLSLPRVLFQAIRKEALKDDPKGLVGKYITRQLRLAGWEHPTNPGKKRPDMPQNADGKPVAMAVSKGKKAVLL